MAGKNDADRVQSIRAADRAHRFRRLHGRRLLFVRSGFSEWNFPELSPNAILKFGAAQLERQIEVPAFTVEIIGSWRWPVDERRAAVERFKFL